VNVAGWQTVPVKSASIGVAAAVPTLPNVPRRPRDELDSPCVLICAGGAFPGDSGVEPVVSIVNQRCVDRMLAGSGGMLVCGITSKSTSCHLSSALAGSDRWD